MFKKIVCFLMIFAMLSSFTACKKDVGFASGSADEVGAYDPNALFADPDENADADSSAGSSNVTGSNSKNNSNSNNNTNSKVNKNNSTNNSSNTTSSGKDDSKKDEVKTIDYTFRYLGNTYSKLTKDKKLKVGFLGGSVTDGTGASSPANDSWARLICNNLKNDYEATVIEKRMSVGGTGSFFAAYRYEYEFGSAREDQPDLLFIEFAINDYYEEYTYDQVVKYSESLVRKALSLNPQMDIVYVLTFDEETRNADYDQLRAHKDVANKYGFLCINLRELLGPVADFKNNYADNVHPNTSGYKVYAKEIYRKLTDEMPSLKEGLANPTVKDTPLPAAAISDYYKNMKFIPSDEIQFTGSGWQYKNDNFSWVKKKYGGVVSANTKDSEMIFKFTGDTFAILYNRQYGQGKIAVQIDDGEVQEFDASTGSQNPKTREFAVLGYGEHTVKITLKSNAEFQIGAIMYN